MLVGLRTGLSWHLITTYVIPDKNFKILFIAQGALLGISHFKLASSLRKNATSDLLI